MVDWIYVFKCEQDRIYVGKTRRLFRRFNEHIHQKNGAINTKLFRPTELLALYKVQKYNDFDTENLITEMLILKNPENKDKIHGGRYLSEKLCLETFQCFALNPKRKKEISRRPFCDCGLPCDFRVNDCHGYKIYCCPLHNVWNGCQTFCEKQNINLKKYPCDYYFREEKDKSNEDFSSNGYTYRVCQNIDIEEQMKCLWSINMYKKYMK